MQVTRELFNQVMVPNYEPSAVSSEKAKDSCVTRRLEPDAMTVSTAKSQTGLADEEKFRSSYETIFSDVVTQCYVRGYN